MLAIENAIVTIDAMGCQRDIAHDDQKRLVAIGRAAYVTMSV